MKASVITEVGKPFMVVEMEIADPIGAEVAFDVKASGLCHTDLHFATTDFGHQMPALFGHEISGVVTAIGPDVTTIAVGDHVVACLVQFCGKCEKCLSGKTYECQHPEATMRKEGQPPRITMDGQPVNQVMGVGGFAEKALMHENQLAVVNKQIPFAQASLIGCAVVTGAGSAIHAAKVAVGDSVAIIGTGGVGLNTISGARLAGARRIIAIDIDDEKLEAAKKFGATDVVNSKTVDPIQAVKDLTGGGVDHAFEVIGMAMTQKQAVEMCGMGGQAYFIGLAKPGTTIELDTSLQALLDQKGVHGVLMGSVNLKADIPMYADFYVQGRLVLDDLVTQEINISEINEAYDALTKGGIIRSVITSF